MIKWLDTLELLRLKSRYVYMNIKTSISIFVIAISSIFLSFSPPSYKIALLKYNGGGDWYANPTALTNLASFCNQLISLESSKLFDRNERRLLFNTFEWRSISIEYLRCLGVVVQKRYSRV